MECHKKMRKFTLKRIVLICGILFLLSYVFLQIANAAELDDIKKAIKDKGAKWTAGDTSVSGLPDNEKKLRTGTVLSGEAVKGAKVLATTTLSSYDWRGYGMVTSIKDQGSCGSCWAFGSIAQLESLKLMAGVTLDLSEQYLVSCVKCTGCIGCGGCNGCDMVSAYNFLKNTGTTDEKSFPYTARNSLCPNPKKTKIAITAKLSQWDSVTQSIDQLKAAVSSHPITVAFSVYNDFFSYMSGVYTHVSGALAGGHAVCIVGWKDINDTYGNVDPSSSYFIVKNSWGTGWGMSGYFNIAYSQVTNDVSFGRAAGNFALVSASPAPPITANSEKVVTFWGNIKSTY